jgi:nicotinamidase-related amidase
VISPIDRALGKCRRLLNHSRQMGPPVAFIRMISEQAFFNCATALVRWIEGPKPCRDELIFERSSPSCYSGDAFTAVVNRSRGGIVLAGFAGESACRSTPVDAFHRNHKVTCLCDVSASHALDETPAGAVRRIISKISGICADVFKTDDWIKQALPWNLGYGKNTGG